MVYAEGMLPLKKPIPEGRHRNDIIPLSQWRDICNEMPLESKSHFSAKNCVAAVVGVKGAKMSFSDNSLTMDIPRGALLTPTVISCFRDAQQIGNCGIAAAAGCSLVPYTPIFKCGPTGKKFAKPITLRFRHAISEKDWDNTSGMEVYQGKVAKSDLKIDDEASHEIDGKWIDIRLTQFGGKPEAKQQESCETQTEAPETEDITAKRGEQIDISDGSHSSAVPAAETTTKEMKRRPQEPASNPKAMNMILLLALIALLFLPVAMAEQNISERASPEGYCTNGAKSEALNNTMQPHPKTYPGEVLHVDSLKENITVEYDGRQENVTINRRSVSKTRDAIRREFGIEGEFRLRALVRWSSDVVEIDDEDDVGKLLNAVKLYVPVKQSKGCYHDDIEFMWYRFHLKESEPGHNEISSYTITWMVYHHQVLEVIYDLRASTNEYYRTDFEGTKHWHIVSKRSISMEIEPGHFVVIYDLRAPTNEYYRTDFDEFCPADFEGSHHADFENNVTAVSKQVSFDRLRSGDMPPRGSRGAGLDMFESGKGMHRMTLDAAAPCTTNATITRRRALSKGRPIFAFELMEAETFVKKFKTLLSTMRNTALGDGSMAETLLLLVDVTSVIEQDRFPSIAPQVDIGVHKKCVNVNGEEPRVEARKRMQDRVVESMEKADAKTQNLLENVSVMVGKDWKSQFPLVDRFLIK